MSGDELGAGITRAEALRRAVRRLEAAGVPGALGDARRLGAWAAGLSAAGYGIALDEPLDAAEAGRLAAAVARRSDRVPLAQIVGRRLFWGRDFVVTADVLDPRPETEVLVAAALSGSFARVLDLGTGSGCILLSLLAERPEATGLGIEASPAAAAVARANARALGLAARARIREGDWFAGVAERFDLVVSNPPYLAEAEMAGLAPEVYRHEPRAALTPGGDGLDAYRAIAGGAAARLQPGGRVLLEVGPGQADPVRELLAAGGLVPGAVTPDLDGRPRVVEAISPE